MATIANRIKEAMSIRGMKQADLVSLTGIGKSSISTYLSGEYEPKQRNIYKIAKVLDVNEAWLMGEDVPMERVDLEEVMKAAKESMDENRNFLASHSGLIYSDGCATDIGCSIHCNSLEERDTIASILMSVTQLSIAEQDEKLFVLNNITKILQHLTVGQCNTLLSYAHFLELNKDQR